MCAFLLFSLSLPRSQMLLPSHQKGIVELDGRILGIDMAFREVLTCVLLHHLLALNLLVDEKHLEAFLANLTQNLNERRDYFCGPKGEKGRMFCPQDLIGFELLHCRYHYNSQMPPSYLHTYPKVFNKHGNLKAFPLRSPISGNYFNLFWITLSIGCLVDAFIIWSSNYAPNSFLYKDRTELLLRKRSFDTLILGNKLESGEEQVRDRSIF